MLDNSHKIGFFAHAQVRKHLKIPELQVCVDLKRVSVL